MPQASLTPAVPSRAARKGSVWPVVIVCMLLTNVCICAITVYAALSNPAAVAVEPDYFQRALDWDEEQSEWTPLEQAGWVVEGSAVLRDDRAIAILTITGRDAETGLRGQAFHKASADERFDLMLVRTGEDRYEAWLPSARAGLWEVRAVDEDAKVRFSIVVEVPSQDATP